MRGRFERLFHMSEARWKSTWLCNSRNMYSWSPSLIRVELVTRDESPGIYDR